MQCLWKEMVGHFDASTLWSSGALLPGPTPAWSICERREGSLSSRAGRLFLLAQIFSQLTHLGSCFALGEQTFTKDGLEFCPVSFREANCSQGCGPTFLSKKAPPCGAPCEELRVQMRWMVFCSLPLPLLISHRKQDSQCFPSFCLH